MYCPNCGKEINDGAEFCPHCGKPVTEKSSSLEKADSNGSVSSKIAIPKIDKSVLKYVIPAVALLVLVIALIVGLSHRSKSVDLEDYITINIEGYSGNARANYSVDYEGLAAESGMLERFYKSSEKGDYGFQSYGFDYGDSGAEHVKHYLSIIDSKSEFDKNINLKNGDTVTLTLTCDKDQLKRVSKATGIKINANGTVTRKVENLEEAVEINPFDFLKVKVGGSEGNATVSYSVKETAKTFGKYTVSGVDNYYIEVSSDAGVNKYYFNLDSIDGKSLSDLYMRSENDVSRYRIYNDQKIKFSVEQANVNYGYYFSAENKTYTVQNLTPLADDPSQITKKVLDTATKDVFTALKQNTFGQFIPTGKVTAKLLIANSEEAPAKNKLILRYEGKYKEVRVDERSYNGFWTIDLSDVAVEDGDIVYGKENSRKIFYDNGDGNKDGKAYWQDEIDQEYFTTHDVEIK